MSIAFVDLKKKKKESQATDLTGVIHVDALLIFQYEFLFSGLLQMEIVLLDIGWYSFSLNF